MRILSIDLDYIMGPSINMYHDLFWNDNAEPLDGVISSDSQK